MATTSTPRYLQMTGSVLIMQGKLTSTGVYITRNAEKNGAWIPQFMHAGDEIAAPFEGCGPIDFAVTNAH